MDIWGPIYWHGPYIYIYIYIYMCVWILMCRPSRVDLTSVQILMYRSSCNITSNWSEFEILHLRLRALTIQIPLRALTKDPSSHIEILHTLRALTIHLASSLSHLETPRRPPGGPRRLPEGPQETPRRPLGSPQETPRRPPGGSQEAPSVTVTK